jgi:hypothetical protein
MNVQFISKSEKKVWEMRKKKQIHLTPTLSEGEGERPET